MNSLELWELVKHVDEKATRQANVDGNSQTSINTLYPIKQFTKAMGPIGQLWKYDIDSERLENTKPMMIKPGEYLRDGENMLWEQTHTLMINFYVRYDVNQEFQKFQHFGHTKYRYVTNAGKIMVDHEYAKKSLSDALKKALTLFGVCADVYGGEFDDREYKESVQAKLAMDKADESVEEMERQRQELIALVVDAKKMLESMPESGAHGANAVYNKAVSHLNNRLTHPILGQIANKGINELKSIKQLKWGKK